MAGTKYIYALHYEGRELGLQKASVFLLLLSMNLLSSWRENFHVMQLHNN